MVAASAPDLAPPLAVAGPEPPPRVDRVPEHPAASRAGRGRVTDVTRRSGRRQGGRDHRAARDGGALRTRFADDLKRALSYFRPRSTRKSKAVKATAAAKTAGE